MGIEVGVDAGVATGVGAVVASGGGTGVAGGGGAWGDDAEVEAAVGEAGVAASSLEHAKTSNSVAASEARAINLDMRRLRQMGRDDYRR